MWRSMIGDLYTYMFDFLVFKGRNVLYLYSEAQGKKKYCRRSDVVN